MSKKRHGQIETSYIDRTGVTRSIAPPVKETVKKKTSKKKKLNTTYHGMQWSPPAKETPEEKHQYLTNILDGMLQQFEKYEQNGIAAKYPGIMQSLGSQIEKTSTELDSLSVVLNKPPYQYDADKRWPWSKPDAPAPSDSDPHHGTPPGVSGTNDSIQSVQSNVSAQRGEPNSLAIQQPETDGRQLALH
jgi:hypothetical protein